MILSTASPLQGQTGAPGGSDKLALFVVGICGLVVGSYVERFCCKMLPDRYLYVTGA